MSHNLCYLCRCIYSWLSCSSIISGISNDSIQYLHHFVLQAVFKKPWDALLKSLIMMSGEYDYGAIFFDNGKVPFPFVTYFMFVLFFLLLSVLALNLLVGLTVDDIQTFLDAADLKNLSLKVPYICKGF